MYAVPDSFIDAEYTVVDEETGEVMNRPEDTSHEE